MKFHNLIVLSQQPAKMLALSIETIDKIEDGCPVKIFNNLLVAKLKI